MTKAQIVAVAWAALAMSGPAWAQAAVSQIVVLPCQVAEDLKDMSGPALDQTFLGELAKHVPAEVKVFGSEDVAAILGHEQQKQLMGCDDTSCLVELGNAMGASHLVAATVGKVGDRYVVSYRVLDVTDASVLFRKNVETTPAGALAAVRAVAVEFAVSQGWADQSALASVATHSQPAPPEPAAASAEDGPDGLFYAGAAVAGVGALLALGLGITAVAVDSAVVGDTSKPWEEREPATTVVAASAGGSVLGILVLAVGATVLGISLL